MKLFRRLSLQQRITLSVSLGLSVVLLVLAFAALWALQESADAALHQRRILARTIAKHVDEVINRSYEILQRTAALPGINLEDDDLTPEKLLMHETQLQIGSFSTITLLDRSGHVLWAEPNEPGIVGSNLRFHGGARRVIESGEAAIAELAVFANEIPQVCLAAPIRLNNGVLVGILMAELRPQDKTVRLLPQLDSEELTLTELVNGQGIVVASSPDEEGMRLSFHAALLADFIEKQETGVLIHEGAGMRRHIVAYAPLSSLPSWGIIIERPEDIVLALPTSLQQQILVFGILAVAAGALLAWADVRRVVGPLGTLTAAAARMGTGDLNSPIVLQREDEIGVLARALETMRSKLKDSLAERERWSFELELRVEQRTKDLSALLEAAEALSAILQPNELWGAIAAETKRLCPAADAGLLATYEKDQGYLTPKAAFGCEKDKVRHIELRPGEGLLGKVFQSGWPILAESEALRVHEQNLSEERRQRLFRACPDIENARSAICVPLRTKQETLGCLAIYAFQGTSPLTANELRLLQAFAVQAATAIENARLYEEVQRKEAVRGELLAKLITAQEEERHRIARGLHDESAQALTALMMAVESVEEALPQLAESQKQRLERAKGLIARALGDVRRLIWDLRPTVLDDLGLAPAVRWFAEQHLEGTGIDIDVQVIGPRRRLPTVVETEVYRILQEATTNVARHARASHLNICLKQNNGLFVATVEDDGIGFDADRVGQSDQQRGLGLLGMQERANLLGGSLVIESRSGKGTRLILNIPVGREGDGA